MNITKMIPVAFAAAIVGISTACGSGNSTEEKENAAPVVEMESYKYDIIANLADSMAVPVDGGEYARVSGQGVLPRRIGNRDITPLRDSLERLGSVLVLENGNYGPRLTDGLTATEIQPNDSVACTTCYNQLSVVLITPQVVVWKGYRYGYMCRAAHGMYNTTFVNYSVAKGKILSLTDIFRAGYEGELTTMLRQKIREGKYDLLMPLEEVGIPADFEVTENGIDFTYGLYEIAPYAAGEITISFYSYELEDLFAPDARTLLYGDMQ